MKWARGQSFIKCGTVFVLLFPTLHKNKDPVGHCDLGIIAESILRIITVWTAKHFSRTHIPLWILCLLLAAVRDISSENTDGDKVSDNRIWDEISEHKNVKWIKWNENLNIRHFKSSEKKNLCVCVWGNKNTLLTLMLTLLLSKSMWRVMMQWSSKPLQGWEGIWWPSKPAECPLISTAGVFLERFHLKWAETVPDPGLPSAHQVR